MHQFLTVAMTSRSAAKLKAVDQARSKLEELTKYDYPCFTFMLTEEGPELLGEEDLTTELMEIFEERVSSKWLKGSNYEDKRLFIKVQEK